MSYNQTESIYRISGEYNQTESIYRISGEYIFIPSSSISMINGIDNILLSGSFIKEDRINLNNKRTGNYQNSYEILLSTGRRENNLSIRDYPITQSISIIKLNNQTSYSIPAIRKNKNIIAVIFSSPGGSETDSNGQRDIESSEYSSNNNTNFRNKYVRKQIDNDLQTPFSSSSYTTHKTNKNTRYVINVNTSIIQSKYDNGFINRIIPYHIDQMLWISESLLKTELNKQSHYIYFNEQTGSEYTYTQSHNGSNLTESWGSNFDSVYGFPSWIQLRAGNTWRHRIIKERSYYYINKKESNQENIGNRADESNLLFTGIFNTSSEGTLLFKEPIVDFRNKSYYIKDLDNNIQIDYFIPKFSFYNKELNNAYGIEDVENSQISILQNYSEYNINNGEKYLIYPNPKDAGLLRTRKRENFIFKYWKDDVFRSSSQTTGGANSNADNTRQVITSSYEGYTIPSLYNFNVTGSIWPLDMYVHPTMHLTGGRHVCGELMLTLFSQEMFSGVYYSQRPFYPMVSYRFNSNLLDAGSRHLIVPWTANIKAKSAPFADNEDVFSKDIIKKYKEYATVPEFNISNKITNQNFSQLNKFLYDNSFVFENSGSSQLNKFTDSYLIKNTLQFNIKSVIKLRPYNNFYPVNITLECAKYLSESLSSVDVYNHTTTAYSGENIKPTYVNIGIFPFYNTGIMYASIKAGIPMQFNFSEFLTTSAIFDFNSIFDPYKNLQGKASLDVEFTETLSTEKYKNLVSNFLEEVRYTFCKNNNLAYFESINEEEYKIFKSGTSYIMDIVLTTGKLDFSSSNVSKEGVSIIGGVNYIGYKHNIYETNVPPWWPGNSSLDKSKGVKIVRITFTPTVTRKYTLDEIFALSNISFHRDFLGNATYYSHPKLTSSFNLFNKKTKDNGQSIWSIESKWEFPYLILTGAFDYFSNSTTTRQIENTWPNGCIEYAGGLWHDFCDIPDNDQGLFLSLKDYNYNLSGTSIVSASLADQVGFKSNIQKRVGELSEQKDISELICIVPINKKDNSFFYINVDNEDEKSENISKTFFRNKKMCSKYVIPPKLDYTIKGNKPVLMFCTEIMDIWSKKDLSYIWQNLLPENGLSHKEKNNIYTVSDVRDLNMLKNKEIYFMIFKCKRRSVSNPIGTYGFNWPWDYCSLVELCNIELITE